MPEFKVVADYKEAGDQPAAIKALAKGLEDGMNMQTLLGVTGSGKTFTMAKVIEEVQRPALVISHNKTLAAQLFSEFRDYFPNNAVRYFVSFYDYYQPEAYIPSTDTYIEKDLLRNEEIEKYRMMATAALLTRRDVVIVASVSCIYGLGSPDEYENQKLTLSVGQQIRRNSIIRKLVDVRYQRNDYGFSRGCVRARGDVLDIWPPYQETVFRVELFGDEIDRIREIDHLTGEVKKQLEEAVVFPAYHYMAAPERQEDALVAIELELQDRIAWFLKHDKLLEAQRIEQRTRFDLEMIREVGSCQGIENYSRHFEGREKGQPPSCLIDYFPSDFLVFVDESHVTLPQIRGMFHGDRSRKETLVEYGFRLPSALDNRPLRDEEFKSKLKQTIFVSATPGDYEKNSSEQAARAVYRRQEEKREEADLAEYLAKVQKKYKYQGSEEAELAAHLLDLCPALDARKMQLDRALYILWMRHMRGREDDCKAAKKLEAYLRRVQQDECQYDEEKHLASYLRRIQPAPGERSDQNRVEKELAAHVVRIQREYDGDPSGAKAALASHLLQIHEEEKAKAALETYLVKVQEEYKYQGSEEARLAAHFLDLRPALNECEDPDSAEDARKIHLDRIQQEHGYQNSAEAALTSYRLQVQQTPIWRKDLSKAEEALATYLRRVQQDECQYDEEKHLASYLRRIQPAPGERSDRSGIEEALAAYVVRVQREYEDRSAAEKALASYLLCIQPISDDPDDEMEKALASYLLCIQPAPGKRSDRSRVEEELAAHVVRIQREYEDDQSGAEEAELVLHLLQMHPAPGKCGYQHRAAEVLASHLLQMHPAPIECGYQRRAAEVLASHLLHIHQEQKDQAEERQDRPTGVVELVNRPTGLVDPEVSVHPTEGQVDHLIAECRKRVKANQRVLVTTLTKRMSEDLTDYLVDLGLKARYLHSDIDTLERTEILRHLREGKFDILVGINLLREGLDLPEVALVAVLDADKEGFLRSTTSLIQTAGRAARNVESEVIMYADSITRSMRTAMEEMERRRKTQLAYNEKHGIVPQTVIKEIHATLRLDEDGGADEAAASAAEMAAESEAEYDGDISSVIAHLEEEMQKAASELKFEKAAALRDQIEGLRRDFGS